MRFSVVAVIGALVACSAAAPAAATHVVHEKRELKGSRWTPSDVKLNRDATLPISIGLAQENLHNGYDFLMDVSDPTSPNYGKHWSAKKIIETFRPSNLRIDAVSSWLADSGISLDRVTLAPGRNWLRFNATVGEVESLLKTEYAVFEHSTTGKTHIACDEYSVPASIREHIDFITPTVGFDAVISKPEKRRPIRKRGQMPQSAPADNKAWDPKKGANVGFASQVTYSPANCNKYITPECLRLLYNIPNGTLDVSSLGIVEYTPEAYLQGDLDLFYANLATEIAAGTAPIIDLIDGAVVQTTVQSFSYNGESDLDLEYAMALVYPQKVTMYQVGDLYEGASFNNFLDAIDGSYCTYEGGDDPTYDAIYPDTTSPSGYKSQDCGTFAPASVISTSYGYNEADLPASYEQRQCNEYMKLGLAGVSVVFSSGDYGVAGNGGQCCTDAACAGGGYNGGDSGTFNPSFPSSCPYVTSVGATQIVPNASVTAPEEACQTVIYSGGGFSNVFPVPDYQGAAVAAYFAASAPSYNATQYNNSGVVRGYPDVSANGANYVVGVDGALSLVYGTSASSPTFASILTLINEQRVSAGQSAVGFINPTIYANPGAFNDITQGGNQGCGTPGFSAVEGWDPVTGLGTPDYNKLLDVFMALP